MAMPPQAWVCLRYHTQMGLARHGTATSRLANTIRSLLFCRSCRGWLGERAHHADQIPAYFFFGAIAFATGHFAAAARDDVEEIAVGEFGRGRRVAPVVQG